MKLYSTYLIVPLFIFCQLTQLTAQFQGKVLDSDSREVLEFVQIGVINKSIGVLSDDTGKFRLDKQFFFESDSLLFSYLGYESQTILIRDLMTLPSSTVFLKKQIFDLPKVTVQANAFIKNKKIGYKNTNSKRMQTGWSGSDYKQERSIVDNPVGERGAMIKLKGRTAFIKNVNFHLANNEYDSIVCRIHLYSIKNGLPDKELIEENVFVKTTKKQGWIKVPIDYLQLTISEDVIATVEWVKAWKQEPITGEGLHFSIGFFGKLVWRKATHQINWKINNGYHMGIYLDATTN